MNAHAKANIYPLRITDYGSRITHHGSRITDYRSRIIQVWKNCPNRNEQIIDSLQSYPNPWKNELEYFDMNAMPRVIPTCPNMNMVHTLSLRDKNYQRYFIE